VTPRILRFDPDAGASGIFYDTSGPAAQTHQLGRQLPFPALSSGAGRESGPVLGPECSHDRAGGTEAMHPVHAGLDPCVGSAGPQHAALDRGSGSFGSPVAAVTTRPGLLAASNTGLWELVQDVERLSACRQHDVF